MPPINRRRFLQASAISLSSLLSACITSNSLKEWTQGRHGPSGLFLHGIASGDPLSDSVILWTRLSPKSNDHSLWIGWELASDRDFSHIVRRGETQAHADNDYTVKIDAVDLEANTEYFFRFASGDNFSPIGRCKTLPVGSVSSVKLAVVSCANYPAGYFHVYREIAKLHSLDAIIHLGDYIYEYGEGGYATDQAKALGREFNADNAGELLTLDDYRKRYAQYRRDNDLQAAHAAAPFITVWDDHEIANDAWLAGAENHQAEDGDYIKRRDAAVRAYFEWMPIRPSADDSQSIYRQFAFGDLVNLMMLDTRVAGRDKQLEYRHYIDSQGEFDSTRFTQNITDPERSLLGSRQRAWLYKTLSSSTAKWQVMGQQLIMGDMRMPAELLLSLGAPTEQLLKAFSTLLSIKHRLDKGDPAIDKQSIARLRNKLPYNLDAWDGYIAEREALYTVAKQHNKHLVVLSGDTHNAWENILHDMQGNTVGHEFATASVSSPGIEDILKLPSDQWQHVETGFTALIEGLRYNKIGYRGYLLVTFEHKQCTAEWRFIDSTRKRNYQKLKEHSRSSQIKSPAI